MTPPARAAVTLRAEKPPRRRASSSTLRVFGSCVTRDAFELNEGPDLVLERYFARSSFASAFCELPFEGVPTHRIASAFQRRMVESDLSREFRSSLPMKGFDRLIVDLVDERLDLIQDHRGALATRSNELMQVLGPDDDHARIRSGSAQFVASWTVGWNRFIDLVDRTIGRDAVIVHRARWASVTESGATFPGQTAASIARANAFLDLLHAVVEKDLPPHQILTVPDEYVVGADRHRWGAHPFHYVDEYYTTFLELVAGTCEENP